MTIGAFIEHYEKVSSTNSVALLKLRDEKPAEGTVITASFQDSGRGQLGNKWESEAGKNLLMSIILYPVTVKAEDQFIISQAVSLAVFDLLKTETTDVRIKWPNDIYVKDDKIAGILIENSIMGNSISSCVAGLGLNVNQEKFFSDAPNPISLTTVTGKEHDLGAVISGLCLALNKRYQMVLKNDTSALGEDYHKALYRQGVWHRYSDRGGEFTGMIESVRSNGLLVVKRKTGSTKEYAFKEIEYLP